MPCLFLQGINILTAKRILGILSFFVVYDWIASVTDKLCLKKLHEALRSKTCFSCFLQVLYLLVLYYCNVLSNWERFFKMRAAFLALSFLHNSRKDGGKKSSSHFVENISLWWDTTVCPMGTAYVVPITSLRYFEIRKTICPDSRLKLLQDILFP